MNTSDATRIGAAGAAQLTAPRVVLVTGDGAGLGRAAAVRFARARAILPLAQADAKRIGEICAVHVVGLRCSCRRRAMR